MEYTTERAAAEILNPSGASPVLLLCEHASNFIPVEYAGLGLSSAELERHIAWDIGAAGVTRRLSHLLDAPAFLGCCSRLLISLNRPLRSPTSIVTHSESTNIPGNTSRGDERPEMKRCTFMARTLVKMLRHAHARNSPQ